jgi:CHAT domain-containing protein
MLAAALGSLPKRSALLGDDAVQAGLIFQALQILRSSNGQDNSEKLRGLRRALSGQPLEVALRREYFNGRLNRANDRLLKLALSSDDFQQKNADVRSALVSEVAFVNSQIGAIDTQNGNEKKFERSAVSRTDAISLQQAQHELAADEALIFYNVLASRSYAFVIRRESVSVVDIDLTLERMSALADDIRPRERAQFFKLRDRGGDLLRGFNAESAYLLYQSIWPKAELSGATSIFIVPDGPLASISFPTLLTERSGTPANADGIRAMPWLLKAGYTMNFIPKPAFLLDRKSTSPSSATPFFVGIGDPIPATCGTMSTLTKSATSDAIDPKSLCDIPRLADATDEVRNVAADFPADSAVIKLGPDATEAQLRQLNESGILNRATLILFATHGLAPGQLDQLSDFMRLFAEDSVGVPAVGQSVSDFMQSNTKLTNSQIKSLNGSLMMSFYKRDVPDVRFRFPPGLVLSAEPDGLIGDSTRDGFLSSTEIGLLNIRANLVILSACNTASENGEFEPSTFSGLTEAFLGAGAEGLVVSHWSVVSSAAKELTPRLMAYLKEHKGAPPAVALQESVVQFMKTVDDPHPFVWGPFFCVGSATHVAI